MKDQEKLNLPIEPYLKIFKDRSIFVDRTGKENLFKEGVPSKNAQTRQRKISNALENGFLDKIIEECKHPNITFADLLADDINLIDSLVNAVTSEVGRAIVGLSVLQLCVKAIEPSQNIRLHKAGRGIRDFSWEDGLSMRTIDNSYITPVLRKHSLLLINKDGFMMTRSLAENYPYTYLYKAAVRGAKAEWLEIVDRLESGKLNPLSGLKLLICSLMRKSEAFSILAFEVLDLAKKFLLQNPPISKINKLIKRHIDISEYSPRLMEISLHSFFQVLSEFKVLNGKLRPLSQMRSANKKHGNIGDIETVSPSNDFCIYESWDCKYGKPYLRDELDELSDKLEMHPETEHAGFVVNTEPDIRDDISRRMQEIGEIHNVDIRILSFDSFISDQLNRCNQEDLKQIMYAWLIAYVESLAQLRREVAPIDEPCDVWLQSLKNVFMTSIED